MRVDNFLVVAISAVANDTRVVVPYCTSRLKSESLHFLWKHIYE